MVFVCVFFNVPSLSHLGYALASSITGAEVEKLKETLSPKPGQTLPCPERDQERTPSPPHPPFLEISGLEREQEYPWCAVHPKRGASRL